ncbi:MAG: polysaccharide export protein [Thermomonas sp.]|jgi:polysaccharide export outer membrane protein|uniref:polysaccharide biosynthesis/export family protein n=1 Tax=Thermomonas sp. TaxID=1971895 RepID=UPI001B4B22AE|nr:polysaccharide biosynthesis/export family protein [Thermomonas sp.]MBK6415669.1 polysaccharide export protein [Thermomonas sp.]MBK6924828.1 polysaccharide export protein [Thermomonas sp.]MBK7206450.1 polysaccharide export protein [Thermomonas sp.]MBP7158549.1 polysaccharide export protein [Thermomonas sp.]MBP8648633.1 polysaccharide export protein [Thermomonas sp.]
MRGWLRFLLIPLLVGLLASCASSGGGRTDAVATSLPAPDTTSASGAYQGGSDYRVGAQDLLEISVFGVKDLEKEVRVNSNGQISLPLIGGVMAGGKTIPELEAELARKYADGFLQNPQVSVFVKEYTSQRITLEGAINKPGIYPITGKTTLLQAIAIGGGLNDQLADLGGVVVMRYVGGKRMAAVYDLRQVRRGTVDNPELFGDDIIVVEQSGSKTAFRRIIESIPVLGVFSFL